MRRSRVPIAHKRVQEKSLLVATTNNTVGSEINAKELFSEHGQPKKPKGTQDETKRRGSNNCTCYKNDLETPDQSVDEVERKNNGINNMPNAEQQEKKTIEFSPIDTVEDTTSNTPKTIKNDSQTKRTSLTERIVAMVGMKPREKEEVVPTTEKRKTFGTASTITTEAKQDDEQIKCGQ